MTAGPGEGAGLKPARRADIVDFSDTFTMSGM